MKENLYIRQPLDFDSDIPIFSITDNYVREYKSISEDHLDSIRNYGRNPFMQKDQINVSETETRLMIRKHLEIGASILDAGIGLGNLFSNLGEYDRYGADISLPYLKVAKSNGIKVSMSKLEELPYRDEFFDAVICCDVLEHVLKLDCVVQQLVRILKSDGKLIVRVPNEENLKSYLTNSLPYSHAHVRDFSLQSLRLYMEKCHELEYIDHKLICYQFYNFSQLKYKLPEKKSNLKSYFNKFFAKDDCKFNSYEKGIITNLTQYTHEELGDVLIKMREEMPELLKLVAPKLIKPIELIMVFKKRSSGK